MKTFRVTIDHAGELLALHLTASQALALAHELQTGARALRCAAEASVQTSAQRPAA